MRTLLTQLLTTDEGQDLVEYALILLLVAVVLAGGLAVFGTNLEGIYQDIYANLISLFHNN